MCRRVSRGLLGCILLIISAAAACGDRPEPEAVVTGQTIPVRTSTVATRDLTETLTLTGSLEPRARVTVVAEVAARLMRVLKDEGDLVEQGAVIAVLDDTDFRLARDRAAAMLDIAEATRAHARVEEDRAASLLKTGGITDKDRVAAQAAVQLAEASYAQARIELSIAERQLSRTEVKAPLSGRVAKRSGDSGAMLAVGSPIFDIVDDAVFEFRASVASSDLGKVSVGGDVTLTVDALPGFSAKGRVTRIVPVVDPRSRSFEVVVRLPGQPGLLSGLFARADIHVRNVPGGLTVPPSALVRDGSDPARAGVFVVIDGKADRRDVTLGVEQPEAVQVTSGLRAGEVVVIDPPAALGPGMPVDVRPSGPTAGAGS
jgi:RND family efflux transporter MFP subunit